MSTAPESPASDTRASDTRVERPATLAETAELLRDSSGSLLFRGAGTKQAWAGRVRDPDLVVDTTGLSGVLTHNPADLTASVLAGTPLRQLQEHVSDDGQWLAIDASTAEDGATVGGLLASGDSGPARLRYGGMRDLVIGMTMVLADGTVARSGGHVIKNVAGYDLPKLLHGSLGTLGLAAEIVVRLHPRPSSMVTVAAPADARTATAATLALMAGPLEPTALGWLSPAGGAEEGELLVRLDGAPGPAERAGTRVVLALAEQGLAGTLLDPADAAQAWHRQAREVRAADGDTVLSVSGRPGELHDLATSLDGLAGGTGIEHRLASQAGLGLHTLRLTGGDARAHAELVHGVREHAGPRGSGVLLRERDPRVDEHLDPLGPPPSTVAVLRRIKQQLDPAGRCGPGRFAGWF